MFTTKNLVVLMGKHAIVTAATVVISLILVLILANQIDSVANSVVQNRKLADKLSKQTELLSAVSHDAAIVGNNDVVLGNAFLPAYDLPIFMASLDNVARKNGIGQAFHSGGLTAAPDAAPFPLSTIDYSNSLSLNITAFSKYLKDFEAMPYFTRIDGINFTASDAGAGWKGTGTATYRAVLYTKTPN